MASKVAVYSETGRALSSSKPGTLKTVNNEHGLCLWLVPTKIHLHLVKEGDSKSRISQCALYNLINLVDDCSEDSIHGK